MRSETVRWLMVLLGMLVLGALSLLFGAWADRWPRVQRVFMKLGDAAITFALGLIGLALVVLTLRALGWLPVPD